jgi:hypothetical protein
MLDLQGIAVRTGHHCAQPVTARFGLSGTIRASLAFYNTTAGIDALANGPRKITTEYAQVLKSTLEMEDLVTKQSAVMDKYDPQKKVAPGRR